MPIGKNAIKRVSNNGYSNVKTEAPDMENSVVEKETKPAEKKSTATKKAPAAKAVAKKSASQKTDAAPAKKTASTKNAAPKASPQKKAAPKKSMEREPELRPVRTLEKITEKSEEKKESYVNFGRELPVHLL